MLTFLISILILAALVWGALHTLSTVRRRGLTFGANIGEGFHDNGVLNLFPDSAMPARYSLVKRGSDGAHIALCGAADIPLGIATDSTDVLTGDFSKPLAVRVFGATVGTTRAVAAGTIALDAFLVPAANGQVQQLPTASGTYYIIGRNVGAAAVVNNNLELAPCFPILRVIP